VAAKRGDGNSVSILRRRKDPMKKKGGRGRRDQDPLLIDSHRIPKSGGGVLTILQYKRHACGERRNT